jgi:hypothetical protein
MTTRSELGESPTTVERLLDKAVGPIDEVARAVRARPIDLVVIAAPSCLPTTWPARGIDTEAPRNLKKVTLTQ